MRGLGLALLAAAQGCFVRLEKPLEENQKS